MVRKEDNPEPEETAFIVISEDDDNTRMLEELQGLRQDVQKVEAGLSAVLGLEGLRTVLEHGFTTNAEILKGFSDAVKRPPVTLTEVETAALNGLFATFARPDFRDVGAIPSAVDTAPDTDTYTRFSAR